MDMEERDEQIEKRVAQIGILLGDMEVSRSVRDDLGIAETASRAVALLTEIVGLSVANERENGRTWDQIGDHFGISRQAAQQRFSRMLAS